MVKTRHHQDADEESDSAFPSLEDNRLTRTRASLGGQHEDSDDSGVINFRQSRNKVIDDLCPTKRSARSSVKRVTYVEDYVDEVSDSETEHPRQNRLSRRRRPPSRSIETVQHDNKVKANADDSSDDEKITTRRRGQKQAPVEMPATRRQRRSVDNDTVHHSSKQVKIEQLADMEESGAVRRSSRNRSMFDDSFNKEMLENGFDEQPRKRRRREVQSDVSPDKEEFTDIYSRVKRQRKVVKRDMYGMPIETDNEEHDEEDGEDNSDDNDDEDDDNDGEEEGSDDDNDNDDDDDDDNENQSDEKRTRRSYNLRENKPRTQHYIAPVQEKKSRIQTRFFHDEVSVPHSPARRRRPQKLPSYMSPARKHRGTISKRRRAFHGSSSTSSSSSSDSSDEEKFQRRKAKSMLKARQRCLPMNFDPDDITRNSVLRDRQKIGSSLADVDPMTIDRSITFDSVGGLGKHVRALKEMVVFPLMYPEIFERFKIAPPRGVLFYGPPGTGKTLMARALTNECSTDGKRVAFYMRKGADCLSKWVGESERQLRLLFDQAYQTRPSIIFFDEIDGLAPVRSSRQDQIHSSIVSTLLALMDGLDSRGEIVVIGATNRLDSIDPALRRPGRFDREFLFPLPSVQARSQILKIHTKEWNPKLCDKFVSEVAEKCIGYCGADMKALCTEVALLALRRRYPQIYTSSEKLQIDVTTINIKAKDFYNAMQSIVPASQRSVASPARALDSKVVPLLQNMFAGILKTLNRIFPSVVMQLSNLDAPVSDKAAGSDDTTGEGIEACSDEEDKDMSIYEQKIDKRKKSNIPEVPESFMNFKNYAYRHPSTHRPRLILAGNRDQGQTSHLAPAVVHHLEQLPVHTLDISALFACSAKTPEESCAHIFREARRTAPSIIYLPHINQWWSVVGETVRSTLMTLIHDLDPSSPVLLLATSEESYMDLDYSVQDLFDEFCDEVVTMRNPNIEERREYFKDLILNQATKPPTTRRIAAQRALEVLPKAPPPEPRKLTDQELKKLHDHEEATLTELRLFLRDVLNKLGRDRKFFIFTKPVDIEDVPDYYDIIKKPMDLSTMMSKIDLHHYQSVKEFLSDIDQICLNALEYNPDKDPQSRVIRHRACALKDTTNAIIKTELDSEFEKLCETIIDSRKKRGEEGTKTAPSFYHTRPLNSGPMHPLAVTKHSTSTPANQQDLSVRVSRRLQGATAQNGPSLEDVERNARALKRLQMSPEKEKQNNLTPQGQMKKSIPSESGRNSSGLKSSQGSTSGNKSSSNSITKSNSSIKKPVRKDIWGRSSYRSRKRRFFKRKISVADCDNDNGDDNDDDDNMDDIDDVENGLDVSVESIDMDDQMEVEEEAVDGTVVNKSPKSAKKVEMRSPRRNSLEKSAEKMEGRTSRKDSLHECLSIDVNMKSPKDGARSPATSQRSPRSDTQKSPQPNSRSQLESPKCSKSPRSDSGHTSTRLSSGMKSPRTLENSVNTNENEQKSKTTPKSSEKQTKSPHSKVIDSHDETSNQCPTEKDTTGKAAGLSVEGFVDSGVGSSDSNGDSNDSVGKLIAAENSGTSSQETVSTQEDHSQTSQNASQMGAPSPVFHLTRSRVQTKTQEKALDILNEQREPLVVDMGRLVRLLDTTVLLTEEYPVPRLEKLYSLFGQCVYEHRNDFNKTQLITSMENRLKQYTTSVASRMRSEKIRASLP